MIQHIPQQTLDASVKGLNLSGATLRDELQEPTLITFLRHFG